MYIAMISYLRGT